MFLLKTKIIYYADELVLELSEINLNIAHFSNRLLIFFNFATLLCVSFIYKSLCFCVQINPPSFLGFVHRFFTRFVIAALAKYLFLFHLTLVTRQRDFVDKAPRLIAQF